MVAPLFIALLHFNNTRYFVIIIIIIINNIARILIRCTSKLRVWPWSLRTKQYYIMLPLHQRTHNWNLCSLFAMRIPSPEIQIFSLIGSIITNRIFTHEFDSQKTINKPFRRSGDGRWYNEGLQCHEKSGVSIYVFEHERQKCQNINTKCVILYLING